MRSNRQSFVGLWLRSLALLATVVLFTACQSGGGSGLGDGGSSGDGGACGCTLGSTRCGDGQIQVCEQSAATCTSWGPTVACPNNGCNNDRCNSTCQDACAGDAVRCASEGAQEVCRIGGSGCFEWVQQSCAASKYCSAGLCVPTIPCAVGCPTGYTCGPSGVCAGGSPTGLTFDVKTVRVSGKLTLNGGDPQRTTASCSATQNSTYYKARLLLTDTTFGNTFYADTLCSDASFTFAEDVYPGTYKVTVQGGYYAKPYLSNMPDVPQVVNAALTVTSDTAGLVFDIKTVQVSGQVTLNGAAPATTTNCSASQNSTQYKARVTLTETTKGYTFYADSLCKDAAYTFAQDVYPGTYKVTAQGGYYTAPYFNNVPNAPLVVDPALVVTANKTGLAYDVKTVKVSGGVTLNGVAPQSTTNCSASQNSTQYKARATFIETTYGYAFYADSLCKDAAYTFAQDVYPGTYKVSIEGGYYAKPYLTNLPDAAYVVSSTLKVMSDVAGLSYDLRTVQVGGQLTLNGAAPQSTTNCSASQNSTQYKARVTFTETTQGYTFHGDSLCQDAAYTFAQEVYPGTYKVTVQGGYYAKPYLSNLPDPPQVVDPALAVTANKTGLSYDVKTVKVSGGVTLNGVAPQSTTNCSASQNSTQYKARATLTETTKGYTFYADSLCKDAAYTFAQDVYPGTYKVTVAGGYYAKPYLNDLPDPAFVVNPALKLTSDVAGLAYDLKTVAVTGQVTLNGAPPQSTTNCSASQNSTYYKTRVTFTEPTLGYTFQGDSLCKDAGYTFAQDVYPGTYKVTVQGGYYSKPYLTNLPDSLDVMVSALQIP